MSMGYKVVATLSRAFTEAVVVEEAAR